MYSRTVLGLADMADAVAELPRTSPRRYCRCRGCGRRPTTARGTRPSPRATARSSPRAEATAIAYSQALDAAVPARAPARSTRCSTGSSTQAARSARRRGAVRLERGGPARPRLGHFFRGCGITILEGYGLTETSPATNSNTPRRAEDRYRGQADPGLHDPDRGRTARSSSRATWSSRATGTTRPPPRR